MMRPATSCMTPRPNCAALPVIVNSVVMSTRVRSGASSTSTAVTTPFAVPVPLVSLPAPSITIVWVASSRLRNFACPAKVMATGPSLTLTLPVMSAPSCERSVAPGMHGASPSTSWSVFHAVSMSEGTTNEFCKSMSTPGTAYVCDLNHW